MYSFPLGEVIRSVTIEFKMELTNEEADILVDLWVDRSSSLWNPADRDYRDRDKAANLPDIWQWLISG